MEPSHVWVKCEQHSFYLWKCTCRNQLKKRCATYQWSSDNLAKVSEWVCGSIMKVMLYLDASELEANVRDSVEKAKQAVALDVTDGKSWGEGNNHSSYVRLYRYSNLLWCSRDGECSSLNVLFHWSRSQATEAVCISIPTSCELFWSYWMLLVHYCIRRRTIVFTFVQIFTLTNLQ